MADEREDALSQPCRIPGSVQVPTGTVVCSSKWISTELISTLQSQMRVIFDEHLGIMDFYPSQSVGIVYVSEADLVGGASYKRKLAKLRMHNKVSGVVLVERTQLTSQYFSALQKFTVLDLGLVLLPILTQSDGANLIVQMARLHSQPHMNPYRDRIKPLPPDEALLHTLQLIPRLGEVKARALLNKYPSLYAVSNATQEELSAVVGQQCSAHVYQFFHNSIQ